MSTPSPAPSPLSTASVWSFRGWLAFSPGELPTLLWIAFLHVSVVVGLLLLPLPHWTAVITALAALFIGGLGTTIVYHRALAHRAVHVHPLIEQVLVFFAMFNGSGSPRSWVGAHRHHHAHSDKPGDISSPHHGGFWWSHLRWLWQADQRDTRKHVRDLGGMRYRIWTFLQPFVLAAALSVGAFWFFDSPWREALAAMLWIGPVRLLWALHVQCSVNSICHLGEEKGEGGSSRNVRWLALAHLGQGENWHGNHHHRPASARIGTGWQLDIGWWCIGVLRRLGLATLPARATQEPAVVAAASAEPALAASASA